MTNKSLLLLFTVSLSFSAANTLLADIYKYVDENGKVIYTDNKPTDETKSSAEKVSIDPDRNVIKAETTPELEALKEQRLERQAKEKQDKLKQEYQYEKELAKAQSAFDDAKKALEEGQKLQAGDYLGKKSGGVRQSEQRRNRLDSLAKALDEAEAELNKIKNDKSYQTLMKSGK